MYKFKPVQNTLDAGKLRTLSERVRQGEDNRYTKIHGDSTKKPQPNLVLQNYYKQKQIINSKNKGGGMKRNFGMMKESSTSNEKKIYRYQSVKNTNEKALCKEEDKIIKELKMSQEMKVKDSYSSFNPKGNKKYKLNETNSFQEPSQNTSISNSQINPNIKDFGNPKENALALLIQSK
ncbi:MAG: hypothetical protein MJ252_07840 [archaeon]|nr:hypothetical protein [archaeon]